jgi:hypothetical protein
MAAKERKIQQRIFFEPQRRKEKKLHKEKVSPKERLLICT